MLQEGRIEISSHVLANEEEYLTRTSGINPQKLIEQWTELVGAPLRVFQELSSEEIARHVVSAAHAYTTFLRIFGKLDLPLEDTEIGRRAVGSFRWKTIYIVWNVDGKGTWGVWKGSQKEGLKVGEGETIDDAMEQAEAYIQGLMNAYGESDSGSDTTPS